MAERCFTIQSEMEGGVMILKLYQDRDDDFGRM